MGRNKVSLCPYAVSYIRNIEPTDTKFMCLRTDSLQLIGSLSVGFTTSPMYDWMSCFFLLFRDLDMLTGHLCDFSIISEIGAPTHGINTYVELL